MEVLELLIGKLVKEGKRTRAERVVMDCFKDLEIKYKVENGLEVLLLALENVTPLVQVKTKKVGGIVYRIPKDVSAKRSISIGISWLLESAKQGKGIKLAKRLSREIMLAKNGEGKAVERVRDIHEFAKKNRGLVKFL